MNILIVGELSGFAKHLKNGLVSLGHYVVITMTGDGWKNIQGEKDDILYSQYNLRCLGHTIPHSSFFSTIKANHIIKKELSKRLISKHVDLIIVINYQFLSSNWYRAGVKTSFIKKQIDCGAKLIMSVCGGDPATRYSHPDVYKLWGENNAGPTRDNRYSFLLKYANVIIPTTYGYYDAIINYVNCVKFDTKKIQRALPLPITIDSEPNFKSCIGRKIIIFHGIIRPQMKGTYYIQPAMDRIQKEYPDKVECICKGNMPYNEYVKLFENIDILIDQAAGEDGWGVNAAIGAMKGKCVLVSCGEKTANNMGIKKLPFVEIERDENQIYETLKGLVLHPKEIDRIKNESREFIEQYCDCKIVAVQYLDSVKLGDNR